LLVPSKQRVAGFESCPARFPLLPGQRPITAPSRSRRLCLPPACPALRLASSCRSERYFACRC